jgi:hypothetical protein
VTYSTKQIHLSNISLHAREVTETQSRPTRQQQKPTPLLQRGSKKRAFSNVDQDGSRKRHKAAQLEENQLPEVTNGGSHSDGKHSDNYGRDDDEDEDMDKNAEDKHGNEEDEDEEDEDEEDEDDEEEDDDDEEDEEDDDDEDDEEDEDEEVPPFNDTEIPGISYWDLLGEDFEREAAALGLYFSCMNYLLS